jgi:carboxyl-terminal processing protease
VKRIIDDFNRNGVDALILDLRKNGGGSLNESVSLTGSFIEQGPVVQVKDSDGRLQQLDDTDKGIAWCGPLVVMVSKFSASASEILAGAIQDYHRGLIVGDSSTHGKGTVQSMMDLGPQLFRIQNPPRLGFAETDDATVLSTQWR